MSASRFNVGASPWSVYILTAWTLIGSGAVYFFAAFGDPDGAMIGLTVLAGAFALALVHSMVSTEGAAVASGAIALVIAIAMLTLLLPTSGNVFIDTVVVLNAMLIGTVLFVRKAKMPSIGRTRLKEVSLLPVLLLPILLAYAEALALGLRFWESFPLGTPSLLFVPFLALWGFIEEALFRGVVQRSLGGIMSARGAIVAAAVLNAAYMLFWGSVMYALFAFLAALLMGILYHRSRSLMYVGTIRALMDTWLIIAFISLGLAG